MTLPRVLRLLALPALLWANAASARVEMTLNVLDSGGMPIPHAMVVLRGRLDANNAPVHSAFGYASMDRSPRAFFTWVRGAVLDEQQRWIDRSQPLLRVELSDEQYGRVLREIAAWRERPQPAYNINRRNCVHFVAAIAAAAGLSVSEPNGLMKRPRRFLEHLQRLNPAARIQSAPVAAASQATRRR